MGVTTDMDVSSWFFNGWEDIARVAIVGLACYVSLIIMLRVSGKRTLSKMNMFDWVITVAMGSVMAGSLSSDATFANTIAAFAVLIGAQFIVTWLSVRSPSFENIVDADPTILYYEGKFYNEAMRRERVPKSELLSAIRQNGQGAPAEIAAIILESNGELVVMNKVKDDQTMTLQSASNWQAVRSNIAT